MENRPDKKFDGDRAPKRDYGDRPPRKDYGDRPPRKDYGDRPPRKDYGDRPPRKDFGDRPPRKDFGDRPPRKDFGDRPPRRDYGDRPPRRDYGDRPPRKDYGDRPPRKDYGDRPPRKDYGDRPPRKDYGDRPPRKDYGDRSPRKDFGDKGPRRFERNDNSKRFNNNFEQADVVETPTWIKKIIALNSDKGREVEGKFLAEGVHCVEEIIKHHKDIIADLYYHDSLESEPIVKKMKELETPIHVLDDAQLKMISSTVTTQGVFAVCFTEASKPDWNTARLVTLVDAVQDPGNLGAIFRSSVGFGMDAVIMGKGTVNPFNPKVVRGSTGVFLRQPFETRVDLAERIQFLRRKGFTIVATSLHTRHTLDKLPKLKNRIAILVGNEGAGADSRYIDLADAVIQIPMSNDLESLNVSVAHGILSYQMSVELKKKLIY